MDNKIKYTAKIVLQSNFVHGHIGFKEDLYKLIKADFIVGDLEEVRGKMLPFLLDLRNNVEMVEGNHKEENTGYLKRMLEAAIESLKEGQLKFDSSHSFCFGLSVSYYISPYQFDFTF
tara:strand:+ start:19906 stop:20259 length:354 start_codon:yes stop_codon:yes gene_type:complete